MTLYNHNFFCADTYCIKNLAKNKHKSTLKYWFLDGFLLFSKIKSLHSKRNEGFLFLFQTQS
jgi:hypothetical protein